MPKLSQRSFVSLLALVPALTFACAADEPPPPAAPVATVTPPPPAPPPLTNTMAHGIDLASMDRSVTPGQDFYEFANGGWLKAATIADDRSSAGPFVRMAEAVEVRMKTILEELAGAVQKPGTPEQRIGDLYASYMDEAGVEQKGLTPLKPTLARIAAIKDAHGLAAYLGSELRNDVDPLNNTNFHTPRLFGLWVEQDLNDPSRVTAYLLQGGLGMPDKSYYVDPSPQMADKRDKYLAYVTTLLTLAKVPDAAARAKKVIALENDIAQVHASRVESEDVKKANNPWAHADFAAKAPGLDWKAYFKAAGLDAQPGFIVWHPAAVTGLSALVPKTPLAVWKDYLEVHALSQAAPLLPKAFVDASFAFFGTALRGTPAQRERWKRGISLVNGEMEDAVGKVYVQRYFKPEYRTDIASMVDAILVAFGHRIEALSWMAPETKDKAKAKLKTLKVGVAYPDVWRDDTGLEISRTDLLGNVERGELFAYKKALAKLGKPADRGEWVMAPQTVNAVNLPVRNALNFPAAILEKPFYDPDATPAVKFAAIGAIIGHEISHSFDDQGALFDATGKLESWWTPGDFAHFEASGAALAKQYDAYHPFPDLAVNGKQCLGENIADLAGLAAAYDAWKASLGGRPAPVIDGLTGDQQFFLSYGQAWQGKVREAALRAGIATDGHAPPQYRALTVRNLDAWYKAFDVEPKEALFLPPDQRVRVW
jgi:putative endopeptidase